MHFYFTHSSCLPDDDSPCSSADRPQRVSRACVSVGSCRENRHPQMRSQSAFFTVAWEQAPEHMLWRGESGVPTDLLLLHIALQPYKGVSLPCVRPQDLCVQYMARTTHTQGISPTVSSPLYSESSPMGTRQDLNHPFPFIHFSLCIFL